MRYRTIPLGQPECYRCVRRSRAISVADWCREVFRRNRARLPEREKEKTERLIKKYLEPVSTGRTINDLDDDFRNALLAEMERRHATERSRNILTGLLRDAAAEAVKRNYIRYNPFLEIPPLHREGKKYPALSEREIRALMALDPRIAANACMQVQLLTGMRPAEARGLCWEDVSEGDSSIMICHQLREGTTEPIRRTKNYKSRKIRPPQMTFDILNGLRECAETLGEFTGEGLIFLDEAGSAMSGHRLNRLLKETIGREDARLHDLRVTHATLLYEGTRDLHQVAKRLGHSGVDVTQRHYVDVQPELSAAAKAQNQYYGEVFQNEE